MRFSRCFAAFSLVLAWQGALAQAPLEHVVMTERSNAFEQASRSAIPGPASIRLLGKATLELAQDHVFVGPPEAFRILQSFDSNTKGSEVLGLVFPKDHGQQWFVSVDTHEPRGTAHQAEQVQASNTKGQGFAPLKSSPWISQAVVEAGKSLPALKDDNAVGSPFALNLTATMAGDEVGRLNAQALAKAFQYQQDNQPESALALLKKYWVVLAVLLLGMSWWVQGRLARMTS